MGVSRRRPSAGRHCRPGQPSNFASLLQLYRHAGFKGGAWATHAADILVMPRRFAFRESACMVAQRKRGVAGNLHERQRTMPGMPKPWAGAVVLSAAVVAAGGCSTLRAIDQWKCDKLGWCCFGTQPSTPTLGAPPNYAPAAECPPAIGAGPAAWCPVPSNPAAVTITTPGSVTAPGTVVGPGLTTVPGPVASPASPSPSTSTAPGSTPPPVLPGP